MSAPPGRTFSLGRWRTGGKELRQFKVKISHIEALEIIRIYQNMNILSELWKSIKIHIQWLSQIAHQGTHAAIGGGPSSIQALQGSLHSRGLSCNFTAGLADWLMSYITWLESWSVHQTTQIYLRFIKVIKSVKLVHWFIMEEFLEATLLLPKLKLEKTSKGIANYLIMSLSLETFCDNQFRQ